MVAPERGPEFAHCTSSCQTGGHPSYGSCLRGKSLSVMGLESTSPSFTREASRKWENENNAYEAARKEGLQPAGVQMHHIDAAKREADTAANAPAA